MGRSNARHAALTASSLLLLSSLSFVPACSLFAVPTPVGEYGEGKSLYLAKDGANVPSARAPREIAAAVNEGLGDLTGRMPAIVANALERLGGSTTEHPPWRPEEVQFECRPATFNGELVLGGTMTFASSMGESSGMPELADGKLVGLRIEAQVMPWPDKKGFLPHPEILLAQTVVRWQAGHMRGQAFAKAIATEVLAEVTGRVQREARARGIEPRTEPVRQR